jgi:hypothetical protein
MRFSRSIVLTLAVVAGIVASSGAARGQHCWPAMVGLVVRDSAGAVLEPGKLDSIAYAPLASDSADFSVGGWHVSPAGSGGLSAGGRGLPTLTWSGRGKCRVDIDEVVLRHGGREMRLRTAVRVNTLRQRGPGVYLVDLPPFRAGTFELAWDSPPGGDNAGPTVIPASAWRRVEAGG